MFDPSQQTFDHFHQKGYSELESYRLAHQVLGRCIRPVPQQPEQDPVSVLENTKQMETISETPDSEIIDLGFDVSAEDVARPVIKGGSYAADVSYARREPTRKSGILQWIIGLKLAEPTTDINGKPVGAGFNLVYRFLAAPSGGMTKEMIEDRLKRVHFAAAGAGKVNSGAWVGKRVQVAVRVREPHADDQGNSYEASNEVSGLYPAKK